MMRYLIVFALGAAVMAASFHVGSRAVQSDYKVTAPAPTVKEIMV